MSASRNILAVVPVKSLAESKSRLGPALDERQRRELAAAMLEDVLAALVAVEALTGLVLTTSDRTAAGIGAAFGARILDDGRAAGLNAAIGAAASVLAAEGLEAMLVLPGDVPAVTAADIAALIERHPAGAAVSVVPSHDGEGTNALLLSPPALLGPAFGPGSFAAHAEAARKRGVPCVVHRNERIAQDVDHPADLEAVLRLGAGPRTTALLGRGRDRPIQD